MTKACDDTTASCGSGSNSGSLALTGSAARHRIRRQASAAGAAAATGADGTVGTHHGGTRMDIPSDQPSNGKRPVLSTGALTDVGKCKQKAMATKQSECKSVPKCCRNAFNVCSKKPYGQVHSSSNPSSAAVPASYAHSVYLTCEGNGATNVIHHPAAGGGAHVDDGPAPVHVHHNENDPVIGQPAAAGAPNAAAPSPHKHDEHEDHPHVNSGDHKPVVAPGTAPAAGAQVVAPPPAAGQ